MLGFESKASICCTIKENLILYYHKFLAFVTQSQFNIFLQQGLSNKETPLVTEIVNFAIESLVF